MTDNLISKDPYSLLAGLLDYPAEDIQSKVTESLKEFKKVLAGMSLDDLQGVYSYTFEMSSDHSLDLGSHILEGFKRSGNLVHIKTMYRRVEFPFESLSKGELPDHLHLVF